MGWNRIFDFESALFEGIPKAAHMYFVHSFFVEPSDFTACRADYGGQFSAALQRENFYGCQFHPEKSGVFGSRILENFLKIKP